MVVVYIILFIVFLSLLIMIHELGHFTAAKVFKVYCLEFSIGFGPKLFRHKRKNGETYFSLRAIPFGGYVSMYGEGVELPDGQQIEESRSLEGVAKWKRAIILFAGVFNNAILALILFFVSSFIPSKMCYYGNMSIAEGSKAADAGLVTGEIIALDGDLAVSEDNYVDNYHLIDFNSIVNYSDTSSKMVCTYFNLDGLKDYKNLDISDYMEMFEQKTNENGEKVVNWTAPIKIDEKFVSLSLNIRTVHYLDENYTEYELIDHNIVINKDVDGASLESFGYSFYLATIQAKNFGAAIKETFTSFGESSTLIVKTLGSLFTSSSTWKNMGGIVAIGFESTSVLQNFGWGKFLYLWGALSVNLAIVNLLPFPGLDGWQLLVLAVEAIFRKKIPNKVKSIISFIGIGILFALMAIILVKDIFIYIF